MRLTVLGSSGTYPGRGKASSGFLLEEGDTRLLLDCGTGVLANLQVHMAIKDVSAIVITHMHPDHFLDLIPLRYALTYGDQFRSSPLPLYFPPGGSELWRRMVAPLDETHGKFSSVFDAQEYREGQDYHFGGLHLQFGQMQHYIPSFGIRARSEGDLVYSSDTGMCEGLVQLARGADLFLCEATWAESTAPQAERGHMTADEAGEAASRAGVAHLALTHIAPYVDVQGSLARARASFGGKVSVAEEGDIYEVPCRDGTALAQR